jgi:hypothetical protein
MRVVIAAVLTLTAAIASAVAQPRVPPDWIGRWSLNLSKSTYVPGPPPYKRASYTIEPWEDGVKVTYQMTYPRGGVAHLEWIGRLDGRDYPLQGLDEAMTYAYARRSDGSYEVIVKVDGRAVATSTIVLSADGRAMTTTTRGRNASGRAVTTITVYEKH